MSSLADTGGLWYLAGGRGGNMSLTYGARFVRGSAVFLSRFFSFLFSLSLHQGGCGFGACAGCTPESCRPGGEDAAHFMLCCFGRKGLSETPSFQGFFPHHTPRNRTGISAGVEWGQTQSGMAYPARASATRPPRLARVCDALWAVWTA